MNLFFFPAGDFSDPEGSSGWTDTSIGNQGWVLFKNSTSNGTKTLCQLLIPIDSLIFHEKKTNKQTKKTTIFVLFFIEEYLSVDVSPGQQLTEAQTRTPLLGPSGPACTLRFDFALTGNPEHIGT